MVLKKQKNDPLVRLSSTDPDLWQSVTAALEQKNRPISDKSMAMLVEETLWALSLEISFGQTVARSFADLIGEVSSQNIDRYRELIHRFGNKGPTLGRIMAEYLVPVLKYGDHPFLKRFLKLIDIMKNKGTYTLKDPLNALSKLLNEKDLKSASVYVDLLGDAFSWNLSYGQCRHFAYVLPRTVLAFSPSKRVWQTEALQRIIKADFHLADSFLDGLEKGLYLLSRETLRTFVSLGIEKLKHDLQFAKKFISLESKLGIDTYENMQITVPLSQVQHQLNRYLRARTGLFISIRPMSSLPKSLLKKETETPFVCSDGKFIYLPEEISKFTNKVENINLYKVLVKLEAGYYEFGTFNFDLEKSIERCHRIAGTQNRNFELDLIFNREDLSDLECFFLSFPLPDLASDLFTIFEHGRIRLLLSKRYPGLVRQTMPLLHDEAVRMIKKSDPVGVLYLVYLCVALDFSLKENFGVPDKIKGQVEKILDLFNRKITQDQGVELSAELVFKIYPQMEKLLRQYAPSKKIEEIYNRMQTPFGRKLRPDLFFMAHRNAEQVSARLKVKLQDKGFKVYKSDIRRQLIAKDGAVSHEDIKSIILSNQYNERSDLQQFETSIDLSWLDLSQLLGKKVVTPLLSDNIGGPVFRYKEWNCKLNDYLESHVRVLDRFIPESNGSYYVSTLKRYQGLVKSIRYAFELLKPEGLVRLRQWIEGDEFDYRALLDFAMDKKAGKIPSDRLYIKRIKQIRDVAVLLLVDLSRSTSNTVYNSKLTILDVEKEAIVLFCEALQVVGDTFAIAAFSGTGRLGVDYFRIKDFDEHIDDTVQQRINAMAPQRSTRMGAAIRHATYQLEKIPSNVRLLIILGDGFPNDVDYKQNYAIEDTRKALFEAYSKNIFAHAITIHFAGDPKLDDLYGNFHHNVISDVRELPDKLLRIYSSLTRY